MQFVPRGQGYTTTQIDPGGVGRSINISPNARRALKQFDPKSGKDPSGIRFAIEHELGRVFGSDSQFTATSGNAGSGPANAVANRLITARNKGKNPRPYLRKHLPYFGQDPHAITWPSS